MLGELIEERRRELDLSLADVAERATSGGYRLSTQSVHQLQTKPMANMPRTETIRGLAHALELPEGIVAMACVESVGVKVPSSVGNDSSATAWLTLTAGRSERQVRHLLRVAKTVAEGWEARNGDDSDEEDSEPEGRPPAARQRHTR